jgi:hypothetical protein
LKTFANRLAHGESILEIAADPKTKNKKTGLYLRWRAFKHAHPEAGKRLYRLAIDNKFERLRAANRERRQLLLAPSVLAPPPRDMDAIIDSIVPRQWEDELRKEVCQELAIEVLERRCECTPAALKSILIAHRNHYHRKYANRWGDASLDEQLFENSELVMGGAVTHHPRGLTQRPDAPKRPRGAEF